MTTTFALDIAQHINSALAGAGLPLSGVSRWFGPPRVTNSYAFNDFYIRFDQVDDGSYGSRYFFDIKIISKGGSASNSPVDVDTYAIYLMGLFDGVGYGAWIVEIVNEQYDRDQDMTIYTLHTRWETEALLTGPCYGGMYADDVSIAVSAVVVGAYYQVASGMSAGLLQSVVFQNARELVCQLAGDYLINWSMSLRCGTAAHTIDGAVMVNGVERHDSENSARGASANIPYSVSGTVLIHLVAGDLVSLCVADESAASTITVTHANLTMIQVG